MMIPTHPHLSWRSSFLFAALLYGALDHAVLAAGRIFFNERPPSSGASTSTGRGRGAGPPSSSPSDEAPSSSQSSQHNPTPPGSREGSRPSALVGGGGTSSSHHAPPRRSPSSSSLQGAGFAISGGGVAAPSKMPGGVPAPFHAGKSPTLTPLGERLVDAAAQAHRARISPAGFSPSTTSGGSSERTEKSSSGVPEGALRDVVGTPVSTRSRPGRNGRPPTPGGGPAFRPPTPGSGAFFNELPRPRHVPGSPRPANFDVGALESLLDQHTAASTSSLEAVDRSQHSRDRSLLRKAHDSSPDGQRVTASSHFVPRREVRASDNSPPASSLSSGSGLSRPSSRNSSLFHPSPCCPRPLTSPSSSPTAALDRQCEMLSVEPWEQEHLRGEDEAMVLMRTTSTRCRQKQELFDEDVHRGEPTVRGPLVPPALLSPPHGATHSPARSTAAGSDPLTCTLRTLSSSGGSVSALSANEGVGDRDLPHPAPYLVPQDRPRTRKPMPLITAWAPNERGPLAGGREEQQQDFVLRRSSADDVRRGKVLRPRSHSHTFGDRSLPDNYRALG